MEESHQRNIIDHLELGGGPGGGGSGHHLQEDLSKGVLRTIQHVENGTLHFITIPPTNSREQEYIESSLLGADLLSSHLPNGLLIPDYIAGPSSGTPSGQFHQQTTSLLDHHGGAGGGIQTYTAEDLQNLVEASSLQTSENERKLFLQFVNKPPSHEAPVIVTNPKDQMSGLSSLGEHDKLTDSQLNHMPVTSSGGFLHYHHQDQLLSSTHVGSMDHGGHIQQNQSHLSSIQSMLQGDCSPSKLFHVTSSAASTNIAINTVTSQNCIQIPPLTPIKRIESPKRYMGYQMVQNQQQQQQQQLVDDNFLSRDDLMECEPIRSDDEEEIGSSHFSNTYLPHKKRLSKKLVDAPPKGVSQVEQFQRDSVIANDHQDKSSQNHPSETAIPKKKAFACQLCSDSFDDQLQFFTHLKGHYEPVTATSPTDDGKTSDPKKKPKLPRVKHTKKLKNDKSSRMTAEETPVVQEAPRNYQPIQSEVIVATNAQQQPVPEQDNPGEFSETEDMLEGIRTAVQKVQEAVEDTNDGLGSGRSSSWYQQQQQPQQHSAPPPMDFNSDLDTQEIHINAGNDNFVLFLNKSDFNEQDILDHPSQQQSQHQQHSILANQLQTSLHHANSSSHLAQPSTSYILGGTSTTTTTTTDQHQQPIGADCDIQNIQILGFSSSEIDFNLASSSAPHQLSELSGARLLKDEQRSLAGSDDQVDEEDAEFYLSDEEENVVGAAGGEEEERVEQRVIPEVQVLPDKKKGRRKDAVEGLAVSEEQPDAAGKKASKKFLCSEPDCDKLFNSKTAVRYHELQHKNERPFCCSLCPKSFFTSSALKVHERLHSGEKPYKCEDCGRAFRQWGDMKYHMASIHSTEKKEVCEFCGKKFARRYSLVLHRKIHLGEKNYVCSICNKAFRASSYLQSHRMIHTGEKPFSCPVCSKKFRCGGDMKRHLKTHDRKSTAGKLPEADSLPKSATSRTTTATKKTATDVIDLTKVKSEHQAKIIQAPPVVTVLAKEINHVTTAEGKADSAGGGGGAQLVYLTTGTDQFRKPNETVLMEMGRW